MACRAHTQALDGNGVQKQHDIHTLTRFISRTKLKIVIDNIANTA